MTVTKEQVTEVLLSVAQEFPGRINGECKYVVDNEPNCVAAVAFTRLGRDVRSLAEGMIDPGDRKILIYRNLATVGQLSLVGDPIVADFEDGAVEVLALWQRIADDNVPWGTVADRAGG